jgi:tetratricopeptide (TPR) repeat protein
MSFLKEYSYSDIKQRKYIYINVLITFAVSAFIISDAAFNLKYYFFYLQIVKIILLTFIAGIFVGNLSGRFFFGIIKKSRIVYITAEILFIIIAALFFFRSFINPTQKEPLISLFFINQYIIPALIFFFGLIAGIKLHYLLKVSCGDFIDEKGAVYNFLLSSIGGLTIGLFIYAGIAYAGLQSYLPVVLCIGLIPLIFIFYLQYNPDPIIAKHFRDEFDEKQDNIKNEELIFSYLNFTYVLIYSYLGFITIMKYYGNLNYIHFAFPAFLLILICTGFLLGRFFKNYYRHIFTEMIFPVFFLIFILLINNLYGLLSFKAASALFAPCALIFGFSMYHAIENISEKYPHQKRFNILDISMIVMPVPVLIAFSFVAFSYAVYFFAIYIIIALNLFLPAIYLANKNIPVYKKGILFAYILLFIPLIIVNHLYFKTPLNGTIYAGNTRNFELLQNVNYNSPYIKTTASVYVKDEEIFKISDSIVRNMKRSIIPSMLYVKNRKDDRVLFIDGNQAFFRNPVISYFRNSVCLDTVPLEMVDYYNLPFSGNQKYFADNDDILLYLHKNHEAFRMIFDIPNIFDQTKNYFRFTPEYYKIIKSKLSRGGIYAVSFNLSSCRKDFLSMALKNIKAAFNNSAVYIFSNILVIYSSDDIFVLKITEKSKENIADLFKSFPEMQNIFYGDLHIFSHYAGSNLDELIKILPSEKVDRFYYLRKYKGESCYEIFNNLPGAVNISSFTNSLVESPNGYFIANMKNQFQNDSVILQTLKKTELAEAAENYELETTLLFELRKLAEYHIMLKEYLNIMYSYKEEYYYNAALRFEQMKKWDNARKLYSAILNMNPSNFEANYRMGIISVTLQDIDNSFKFLQNALKLKNEDGKVLYQMGILYFTTGNFQEAVNFLQRALAQREVSASLYLHLGLSYEQLGNTAEAENYFLKANIQDPNDINIQNKISKIKKNKTSDKDNSLLMPENKNENDVESDERIPLPINKSAYDMRLKDEELSKYKIDGQDGEKPVEKK